jgi:Flp pilus assembly protein TadG
MSDKSRTSNPGAPRGLRDRAGQALAEMVLVTPILLLLVFGIIEFGLAFRTHQIMRRTRPERVPGSR